MNGKQKVCIWIGIASFVMMGILPPWVYRFEIEAPRRSPGCGEVQDIQPGQCATAGARGAHGPDRQ